MNKFQKIQMIISVVPFLSSFFVFGVTNVIIKKNRSNALLWVYLALIMSISVMLVIFWNVVIMTGQNPILNIIASGALLAIANYLCIKLQIKSEKEKDSPQPKAKVILGSIGLSILGLAVSIGLALLMGVLQSSADIADLNGENTALAIITEDEIATVQSDWSSSWSSIGLYGEHTNVSKENDEYDYDKCSYSTKKINGIKTIQITNLETDTLILNVASVLESGNLEIFIIIDGKIYEKVPVGQSYTITLNNIANKDVIVRLGAESAKMSIVVTREYDGVTRDFSENHFWD